MGACPIPSAMVEEAQFYRLFDSFQDYAKCGIVLFFV